MDMSIYRIAPMVLIMGAIFVLSHQPGTTFEMMPFVWSDKFVHLVAYGVLAASVFYALPQKYISQNRKIAAVAVVLVCFIYGCIDEFHQSFIPGRFPGFDDIAADTVGAILVALIWFFYKTKRRVPGD